MLRRIIKAIVWIVAVILGVFLLLVIVAMSGAFGELIGALFEALPEAFGEASVKLGEMLERALSQRRTRIIHERQSRETTLHATRYQAMRHGSSRRHRIYLST